MMPNQTAKNSEPPNRTSPFGASNTKVSRAIRLKLIMLVSMLLLVIYSMKVAGDPKLWERLLRIPPNSELEEGETQPDLNDPVSVNQDSPSVELTPTIRAPSSSSGDQVLLHEGAANTPVRSDYPVAAAQFWKQNYGQLNSGEQANLFRLLKSMRNGVVLPESDLDQFQKLVSVLREKRESFHQSLFDELTLTSNRSSQKAARSNELYESQEIWEKGILPAMTAAANRDDFTVSQQKSVVRLQTVLDELSLRQVRDQQAIGWAGDAEAWKRLWEKTITDPTPSLNPTTHIQLMGQPNLYRGKQVTVEGWVRSARKKVFDEDSELGMSHCYILWVRPKESKLGPFCIYTQTLPDSFPEVSDFFSDMNENIRASGYFFKIRTYVAADESVQNCPVIIAQSVSRVVPPEPFTVARWNPSRTTLIVLFAMIPLLALAFAWFAFQSSNFQRTRRNQNQERRIDQSLSQLVDDPNVQTDEQKIMSLQKMVDDHDQA